MHTYNYDVVSNTLTMSAAFAKAAGILNTPEYNVVKQLRTDYPNLKIELMDNKKKKDAEKRIKYKAMENYMKHCRDSEKYLSTFERVKLLSKGQPFPYKYVLTWFEAHFPAYSEQPEFDDDGFVIERPNQQKSETKTQPDPEKKPEAEATSDAQTAPVMETAPDSIDETIENVSAPVAQIYPVNEDEQKEAA